MSLELNCYYFSTFGLLHSCDVNSNEQNIETFDFSKVTEGCSVYVNTYSLFKFYKIHLPKINCKFILVSGHSDDTVNEYTFDGEFDDFISSDKITHWYAQNCVIIHPKITNLPIGLDYHTLRIRPNFAWGANATPLQQEKMLMSIRDSAKPFWERNVKCYSTFHLNKNIHCTYIHDRLDAVANIDKNVIDYEPNSIERELTWKKQCEYAFVVSPHGNGLDCHRTWEALALGCIVIVKASDIDAIYDDLPILIVEEWCDISMDLLKETIETFKTRSFKYDKLSLQYWQKEFENE